MKINKMLIFKLLYFSFIGGLGAFMPYFNVWLEKQGLVGSQIGQVSSLGLILTVVVMPLWGMIADKTKKHKEVMIFSLALSLVAIFVFAGQSQYFPILLCSLFLNFARCGIMPMADSQVVSYTQATGENYGSVRGMGSLGYALMSMLVGFVAEKMDLTAPLFGIYGALMALSLILAIFFPKTEVVQKEEKEKFNMSAVRELITNKNFLFILLTLSITTALIDSAHLYSGNHLLGKLGASTSIMSWMTLVTVVPEVIFLSHASKFLEKWGYKKFYMVMSGTVCIRLFVYAIAPNPYLYLAVSVVHCIHVACHSVGNLSYIKKSVNPAVLTTAITIMNTFVSLSQAAYGYLFGIIYEKSGSNMIFAISAAIAAVAFIMISRTHRFDHMNKQ